MEETHDAGKAIREIEANTQAIVLEHDPYKNPKAISLIQQKDGNWRGWAQKNGKIVTSRTNDPQTVLLELITHE
jgi:hypothetical protein